MTITELDNLAALINRERNALLSRWRGQVRQLPSARRFETPTLNDHVPLLVDELLTAFKLGSGQTIPEAMLDSSPPLHGLQRHEHGFDIVEIVEIVAEYNILRGCIHNLAESHGLSLHGKPLHILNRKHPVNPVPEKAR